MKGIMMTNLSLGTTLAAGGRGFARLGVVAALLVAGMFLNAPSLHADSFNLTVDHCTGGCGTAPFGVVTLTQNGANVGFLIDLADGPPNTVGWAKTGAGDFEEFKFNATGVVVGDISVTQTFAGQTLAAETGAFNGDGTGAFSFGIACTTCGNGNLGITSNIVFSVANATIADFTAANSDHFIFAADVFSGQTGNTGPVAVPGTPVPEPTPLLLLGFALPLIGLAVRRFRKSE
jgi:hypothetical protein